MHVDPFCCEACGYTCDGGDEPLAGWEAVAYHEAGHTIGRYLCLHEGGAVCIHPDGSGYSAPWREGRQCTIEDMLRVTLAGPLAELISDTNCFVDGEKHGACQDFKEIRDILQASWYRVAHEACGAAWGVTLGWQVVWVMEALQRTWKAVEGLATELLNHGWLSAEEVATIIHEECSTSV